MVMAEVMVVTKGCCSTQYRLVFALGSVVAHEAVADALCVVAEPSARAVAARFVAVALHDVRARGALEQRAVGPSSTQIAHAPHLLLRVPVCQRSGEKE